MAPRGGAMAGCPAERELWDFLPEHLTVILGRLPAAYLLRSARVSTMWRDVVAEVMRERQMRPMEWRTAMYVMHSDVRDSTGKIMEQGSIKLFVSDLARSWDLAPDLALVFASPQLLTVTSSSKRKRALPKVVRGERARLANGATGELAELVAEQLPPFTTVAVVTSSGVVGQRADGTPLEHEGDGKVGCMSVMLAHMPRARLRWFGYGTVGMTADAMRRRAGSVTADAIVGYQLGSAVGQWGAWWHCAEREAASVEEHELALSSAVELEEAAGLEDTIAASVAEPHGGLAKLLADLGRFNFSHGRLAPPMPLPSEPDAAKRALTDVWMTGAPTDQRRRDYADLVEGNPSIPESFDESGVRRSGPKRGMTPRVEGADGGGSLTLGFFTPENEMLHSVLGLCASRSHLFAGGLVDTVAIVAASSSSPAASSPAASASAASSPPPRRCAVMFENLALRFSSPARFTALTIPAEAVSSIERRVTSIIGHPRP